MPQWQHKRCLLLVMLTPALAVALLLAQFRSIAKQHNLEGAALIEVRRSK